jgi:hypothetical protein
MCSLALETSLLLATRRDPVRLNPDKGAVPTLISNQTSIYDWQSNVLVRCLNAPRSVLPQAIRTLSPQISCRPSPRVFWRRGPPLVTQNRYAHKLHVAKSMSMLARIVYSLKLHPRASSWTCPASSAGELDSLDKCCSHQNLSAAPDSFMTHSYKWVFRSQDSLHLCLLAKAGRKQLGVVPRRRARSLSSIAGNQCTTYTTRLLTRVLTRQTTLIY